MVLVEKKASLRILKVAHTLKQQKKKNLKNEKFSMKSQIEEPLLLSKQYICTQTICSELNPDIW